MNPLELGAKCHSCPLRGKKPVFASRSKAPRFVIVGEAPGPAEEYRGLPFVGRSGKLLDRVLRYAKLSRHEAHVTNAMLCNADTDQPHIKLAATSCCAPRLARELRSLRKLPIFSLGRWSTLAVTGARTIIKSRGFVWESPVIDPKKIKSLQKRVSKAPTRKNRQALYLLQARSELAGRVIFPSVHPAFILRGADGWFPVLRGDARRLRRFLDGKLTRNGKLVLEDEAPYVVASTASAIRRLIGALPGIAGAPGNALSLDVETRPAEGRAKGSDPDPMRDPLLCVGLSNGIDTVIVHPWKPELAPALLEAIKDRTIVTHHGPQFDQIIMRREGAWS